MSRKRKINEEGKYDIKRVISLPKKSNANWLYSIIGDPTGKLHKPMANGTYEVVIQGGGVSEEVLDAKLDKETFIEKVEELNALIDTKGVGATGPTGATGSGLKVTTWSAGAYALGDQVNHLGKDWTANAATVAGDVPATSTKWVERLSGYAANYFSINKLIASTIVLGFKISDGQTQVPVADADSKIAKIPALAGQKWYISRPSGFGLVSVTFFTSADVTISQIQLNTGLFVIPANTAYFAINLRWDGGLDITNTTIVALSEVAIPYQAPLNEYVEGVGGLPILAKKLSQSLDAQIAEKTIVKVKEDLNGTNLNKNFALINTGSTTDWYSRTYGNVVPTTNATLLSKGLLNVVKASSNFYFVYKNLNVDIRGKFVQAKIYVLATDIATWTFKFYSLNVATNSFTGPITPSHLVTTLLETGLWEIRMSYAVPTGGNIVDGIYIGGGTSETNSFAGGFLTGISNLDIRATDYINFFYTISTAYDLSKLENKLSALESKETNRVSNYLLGKKMNILGDSITFGYNDPQRSSYGTKLALRNSMDYVGYGVPGAKITGSDANAYSVRYLTMRDDVDFVGVYGGTNDSGTVNVGTITDTTNATLYGSLHILCDGLLTKYPTARVFMIAPSRHTSDPTFFVKGKAIEEVCAMYGIPVLNLAKEGGINQQNTAQYDAYYGSETLHPNTAGHLKMSYVLQSFLERIAAS
jgi:lysophospholipase L1-like esterase